MYTSAIELAKKGSNAYFHYTFPIHPEYMALYSHASNNTNAHKHTHSRTRWLKVALIRSKHLNALYRFDHSHLMPRGRYQEAVQFPQCHTAISAPISRPEEAKTNLFGFFFLCALAIPCRCHNECGPSMFSAERSQVRGSSQKPPRKKCYSK